MRQHEPRSATFRRCPARRRPGGCQPRCDAQPHGDARRDRRLGFVGGARERARRAPALGRSLVDPRSRARRDSGLGDAPGRRARIRRRRRRSPEGALASGRGEPSRRVPLRRSRQPTSSAGPADSRPGSRPQACGRPEPGSRGPTRREERRRASSERPGSALSRSRTSSARSPPFQSPCASTWQWRRSTERADRLAPVAVSLTAPLTPASSQALPSPTHAGGRGQRGHGDCGRRRSEDRACEGCGGCASPRSWV